MNDTELDRMLARALDVAPSPDFTARVRTRIAEEPRRRAWLGPALWAVGATGALAAAVLALVALLPGRPSHTPEPSTLAASRLELPVTTPLAVPSGTTLAPAATTAPAAPRQPEVLVPDDDRAALWRLVAAVHAGAVPAAMLPSDNDADAAAPPIETAAITLAPIDVEPISISQ